MEIFLIKFYNITNQTDFCNIMKQGVIPYK